MKFATPVIQLLLTGNEVMAGDTVDSNSAMIAQRLKEVGLGVQRKVTVGDDPAILVQELLEQSRASDILIVNGGLGPTVDDLTAQVLAEAAGQQLVEHPTARAHLEQWCQQRKLVLNDANLKQAWLPQQAEIVPNPIGSAVGFQLLLNDCLVICTPGVPSELRRMLDTIVPTVAATLGQTAQVNIIRLQTFGLGESTAQQMISDHISDWPSEVELGFRAGAPQMEIKLTTTNAAHLQLQQRCKAQLLDLFQDHVIGEGDCLLAERVLQLLVASGSTLTTAESCTGGLIASMLTRIPGASEGFHAGFVTYADPIKTAVLGVSARDLQEHGAVSETVVRQMALGALDKSGADYAIAVSGIAGPDGGSTDKPVGTVWLAWGSREALHTRCLLWPVERGLFQTMIAAAGLDMIRRQLLGLDFEPRYFAQRNVKT